MLEFPEKGRSNLNSENMFCNKEIFCGKGKVLSLGMDHPDDMFFQPLYKLFCSPWI
jgi:hypothetical protein